MAGHGSKGRHRKKRTPLFSSVLRAGGSRKFLFPRRCLLRATRRSPGGALNLRSTLGAMVKVLQGSSRDRRSLLANRGAHPHDPSPSPVTAPLADPHPSASEEQQQVACATEYACREARAEQCGSEGEGEGSRGHAGGGKKAESWSPRELPPIPYSPSQRILLVGEGDFSFTRGLLRRFGGEGGNVVATCLDSREVLLHKYEAAAEILEELSKGGVALRFGVDGTRLQQCLQVGKKKRGSREDVLKTPFDRVLFNFPHVGLGIKDQRINIEKNRQLLSGFFGSAVPLLSTCGEIHVTLKTGEPYARWNVPALAQQTGVLKLKGTMQFLPQLYPGYAHRRTIGYVSGLSSENNEEVLGRSKCFFFSAA